VIAIRFRDRIVDPGGPFWMPWSAWPTPILLLMSCCEARWWSAAMPLRVGCASFQGVA